MTCSTIQQQAGFPTAPTPDSAAPAKIKFSNSDAFLKELKRRVDLYFQQTGQKPRDCPQIYFKTAVIVLWFLVAYSLLVFVASSWWTVIPLAAVLGLAMAAVGFNIQHDGGHRAYSNHQWVNRIM